MQNYLEEIQNIWKDEVSRNQEHAYRLATQKFLKSIDQNIEIINEADKIKNVGKPDFTIKRKNISIAFIEMKVLGYNLDKLQFEKDNNDQFDRYAKNLSNFCISNNLEFRFFQDGVEYNRIVIGEVDKDKNVINFFEKKFVELEILLKDFFKKEARSIKSANDLAKRMAIKAKLIKNNAFDVLQNTDNPNNDIKQLEAVFKEFLIHDLSDEEFADMYAQTIVYGLFIARYSDKTIEDFSLFEAVKLIPKTNPFLQKLFSQIVKTDQNEKELWVIEELVSMFKATDFQKIFENWGSETKREDPVVHFYETFLKEFDKETRKKRGVYYTPMPVVEYIVAFTDKMLKEKFEIMEGLANREKIKIDQIVDDARGSVKMEVPKVQVLDPATGTGTFLNEVIKFIYNQKIKEGENAWKMYAKEFLVNRLIGFELMISSYTIAHLKLGITLKETGIDITERLKIYLTNTLEQGIFHQAPLLMGDWMTAESRAAGIVKKESPIMVVMGNPPYSVNSSNKSEYILDLIKDYKKDLNERKINLDDDYIKFIRFSEEMILKNGEGIVAMITNNSFISGVTHRQMRKHLLETFDEIYILNLSPENVEKDENVFEIKQGVSINIFVKNNKKKKGNLGQVFYSELSGKRNSKFEILKEGNIKYKKLNFTEPYYFFVPKDFSEKVEYDKGFSVEKIFGFFGSGIKTERDYITISEDIKIVKKVVSDFENLLTNELNNKYNLYESRDWGTVRAKADILANKNKDLYIKINYRPFDERWTWYSGKSKGFIGTPGLKVKKMLDNANLSLVTTRQLSSESFQHVFVMNKINEISAISNRGKESNYVFPLYLYTDQGEKIPNLDKEIWNKINESIGAKEGETSPENILDYIYAVLHSLAYREKYKEFLKIDFPKVPFPKDKNTFWSLVKIGERLRKLHLLDEKTLKEIELNIKYEGQGNNIIDKVKFVENKVYINATQYFENIPEIAWNFYVGGYQPAQKWLKDRKGRVLNYEDILHYQKIIKVLVETDKIMREIDEIKL